MSQQRSPRVARTKAMKIEITRFETQFAFGLQYVLSHLARAVSEPESNDH